MLTRIFFCAFFAIFLAGCSSQHTKQAQALSRAPLEAGHGLGWLRLGATSLSQVLSRLGLKRFSFVASDEMAIELSYEAGGLILQFVIQGECKKGIRSGDGRKIASDLTLFLRERPECAQLPLSSLSVGAPFYKGQSNEGAVIGAPLGNISAHGKILERAPFGVMIPGVIADHRLHYSSGIAIDFRPDPDNKIANIRIERMAIFAP